MKNLEQIRAENALHAAPSIKTGSGEGDSHSVAKKVPTLIKDNGLLATAAYAKEKNNGLQRVIEALELHLKHKNIALMPENESDLLSWLSCRANSTKLRLVTAESLTYLSYLRRFTQQQGGHDAKNSD